MTDEECQLAILQTLARGPKEGLEEGTIKAVIALEHTIGMFRGLVAMCLEGKLRANFVGGDEDNILDTDLYEFSQVQDG